MSAQDRLAAIIAEHEWCPRSTAWYEPYGACGCGHNTAQDGDWKPYDVGCWATHVAAVIASSDDLAVIETRPVKVYREGGEWMCETDDEVGSVLPVGAKDWEIDEIEGQLAEAIAQVRAVRAARAAEAVSDRG